MSDTRPIDTRTVEELNKLESLANLNFNERQDLQNLILDGKSCCNTNFSRTNITTKQLNGAKELRWANLSFLDLLGLDLSDKSAFRMVFRGSSLTGRQLNLATDFAHSDLSGLDLMEIDFTGKSADGVDFSFCKNLTAQQLAKAFSLVGTDISETEVNVDELVNLWKESRPNPPRRNQHESHCYTTNT